MRNDDVLRRRVHFEARCDERQWIVERDAHVEIFR